MRIDTLMKVRHLRSVLQNERINFLLTNRVPRIALTRLMGRVSRFENRLFTRVALRGWRVFTDLDLSDAQLSRFDSLHQCFTRELVAGARDVDMQEHVLSSPCDAIVGSHGRVENGRIYQAKGFPYAAAELFGSDEAASVFEGGSYVTLRLTSAMYHRFHAPADGEVQHVTYISGDTWNVNPIALQRVQRLFCRNERAVIHMELPGGVPIALVPVAAILVASIRLRFLDVLLHLKYRGPNEMPCSAHVRKGEEMGWFEHGSTIIVFVPRGYRLADGIDHGVRIRMGQALLEAEPGIVIESSRDRHAGAMPGRQHPRP